MSAYLNFNLILDIPPEKQGVRQNWTLTYYPSKEKEETVTTTYYAHIGMIKNEAKDTSVLFVNWDGFLSEYFLTAGKAHEKLVGGTAQEETGNGQKEKLIESFRNYAPTLYKVLTDKDSPVKAIQNFPVGNEKLNVFAVTATADDTDKAKDVLTDTCVNICKEINTTTHLAVWRRYLRTVWLHN